MSEMIRRPIGKELYVEEFLIHTQVSVRTWNLLKDFAQRMPERALKKLIDKDFKVLEAECARVVDIGCLEGSRTRPLVLLEHHYLSELSDKKVIGVLAHEFAHVVLDHPSWALPEEEKRIQEEANKLASKWGFAEEIKL